MAYYQYPCSLTRTLDVSATLRSCWTTAVDDDIPFGATGGGLSVSLAGASTINVWPYIHVESHTEIIPDEEIRTIIDSVTQGWYVEWNEPTTGTRRAMYCQESASTSGGDIIDTTFSISLSGSTKRMYQLEYPAVSHKLWADPLGGVTFSVEDIVESYDVEITLGGTTRTFTWQIGANALANGTIDIRTLAGSVRGISQVTIGTDGEPEWQGADGWYPNQAKGCKDVTWVEGTYSRSPGGVCAETRSYSHGHTSSPEDPVGAMFNRLPDTTVTSYAYATMGNGAFACGGGTDSNGSLITDADGLTTAWGAFRLQDLLGSYSVSYENQVKDLDEAARLNARIETVEGHPEVVSTEHDFSESNNFIVSDTYIYNGVTLSPSSLPVVKSYVAPAEGLILTQETGWTVVYSGRATFEMLFPNGPIGFPLTGPESFFDLNCAWSGGQIPHGDASDGIPRLLDVKPTWHGQTPPVNGEGYYTEGSMGEPAHPPWEPMPTQATDEITGQFLYVPETGEPVYIGSADLGLEPWYDDGILVDGTGAPELPDALTITMGSQPGELVPNPPVVFANYVWTASNCTVSDSTFAEGGIKIQPSGSGAVANVDSIFASNTRVTGARFLRVHWYSTSDYAQAVLHLGKHWWALIGDLRGPQTTEIDVCCPDGSESDIGRGTIVQEIAGAPWQTTHYGNILTESVPFTLPDDAFCFRVHFAKIYGTESCPQVQSIEFTGGGFWQEPYYNKTCINWWTNWIDCTGYKPDHITATYYEQGSYGFYVDRIEVKKVGGIAAAQSIVPFEKPMDTSVWDSGLGHGRRADDSTYEWDFPTGWGIGRLTKLEIECKTPGCAYEFYDAQFYRKSVEDGGFVKLYVLPGSGSWIDSRSLTDWSLYDTGRTAVDPESIYQTPNNLAVWPKAFLVVDGAVVFEIPAGTIVENFGPGGPQVGNYIWCPWYEYVLSKITDDFIGYPLDDYSSPTCYPLTGIQVSTAAPADDFWTQHCLTAFLAGGVYEPDQSNQIKVPLRVMPRYWNIYPDSGVLPTAAYKRLGARVNGLLLNQATETEMTISTPDASPGRSEIDHQTTNKLGWYESKALNTKGPAEVEAASRPAQEITLRNRVYSRLNCAIPELVLRFCNSDGSLKANADGTLSLECC